MSRVWFFSGISPWSGPWEYRHGGRGPGRGNPSPRAKCHPTVPLRPRFALLPRPLPGARAVMAISRGKPCPGSGADAGFPGDGESEPESGSSPESPRALDRGGYRHGVGQYVGIPGTSHLPRGNPPDSVKKINTSPPLRVPVIGNRCTSTRSAYILLPPGMRGSSSGASTGDGGTPRISRYRFRYPRMRNQRSSICLFCDTHLNVGPSR